MVLVVVVTVEPLVMLDCERVELPFSVNVRCGRATTMPCILVCTVSSLTEALMTSRLIHPLKLSAPADTRQLSNSML